MTFSHFPRRIGVVLLCASASCTLLVGRDTSYTSTASITWNPGPHEGMEGESLFRRFLRSRPDVGDGPEPRIPSPFPKLVAELDAQLLSPMEGVLIPRGRSLQRRAGLPREFERPRVVAAVTSDAKQTSTSLGLALRDKLFLGFSEAARELQIISYNESAGRFEFEVVENYGGNEGAPKLVTPPRATCVACHQNQGPLFSRYPWSETNANADVARLISQARGGTPTYLDFNVATPPDAAWHLMASTQRASRVEPLQQVWRQGCGGDDAEAVSCRRLALRFGLEILLTGDFTFQSLEYARLRGYWERFWPKNLPHGVAVFDALLLDRDPLKESNMVRPLPERILPPAEPRVASFLREKLGNEAFPAVIEPLNPRTTPREVWRHDESGTSLALLFGISSFFTAYDRVALQNGVMGDLKKLDRAVNELEANTRAGKSDVLGNAPLRRELILTALLAALGRPVPVSTAPAVAAPSSRPVPAVTYPPHGTTPRDLSQYEHSWARAFGMTLSTESRRHGVLVDAIVPLGYADVIGLEAGDVIRSVNGEGYTGAEEFERVARKFARQRPRPWVFRIQRGPESRPLIVTHPPDVRCDPFALLGCGFLSEKRRNFQ